MKSYKLTTAVIALVVGSLTIYSCADLAVDNVNEPGREDVLADIENTLSVLDGAYSQVLTGMVNSWGSHPNMLADQNTSTNLFRQYWDFAEEPRVRMNNTTAYSATGAFTSLWGSANSGVASANFILSTINVDGVDYIVGGEDLTQQTLANAYFLRGLGRGYIGLVYDQGYLIDEDFDEEATDPTDIEFSPYDEIIQAAVADIEQAIQIVENLGGNYTFDMLPSSDDSWNSAEFIDIANSFAARFLAGSARTPEERDQVDWQQVLNYADAGLGGPNSQSGLRDFTGSNVSGGEFANYMTDWLNFIVACQGATLDTCSGYNPLDVKVIHTLDPTYPTEYPAEHAGGSATLDPGESDDPRINYFQYTTNPGFLDRNRNANLFSNYFSLRQWAGNDWWAPQWGVTLFTDVEVQMLRAEAHLMLGNNLETANILNESPAGDGQISLSIGLPFSQTFGQPDGFSGGHTYTGVESMEEFMWALHREYTVELNTLGAYGLQWYFMRRHDLLQPGTPTHFAVPGQELEQLQRSNYTFGGVEAAGQPGTAAGNNSWKNLAEAAGFETSKTAGEQQYGSESNNIVEGTDMEFILNGNISTGNEVRKNQ